MATKSDSGKVTRRRFMQGAAAAAAAAGSVHILGAAPATRSKTFKVGLIGCGSASPSPSTRRASRRRPS